MEDAGGSWRLFEAANCWGPLGIARSCWRLLEAAGGCWKLLEAAGECWRLLEAAGAKTEQKQMDEGDYAK